LFSAVPSTGILGCEIVLGNLSQVIIHIRGVDLYVIAVFLLILEKFLAG